MIAKYAIPEQQIFTLLLYLFAILQYVITAGKSIYPPSFHKFSGREGQVCEHGKQAAQKGDGRDMLTETENDSRRSVVNGKKAGLRPY